MTTTEKDIETAIAGLLNKSGFNVTASELKRDFQSLLFSLMYFPQVHHCRVHCSRR